MKKRFTSIALMIAIFFSLIAIPTEISAASNPVTYISISGGTYQLSMEYGDIEKLTVSVLPEDADDKSIVWTSSDPSVVSVDSKGKLTAKNLGDVVITATNKPSGVSESLHVYVGQANISNAQITLSKDKMPYTGKAQKPKVTVTNGKQTLVEGTDYNLEYNNNVNASTSAYVGIVGIGNYMGYETKYFTIDPIVVQIPKVDTGLVYNGKSQLGVPKGVNYSISGNKEINAGEYYVIAQLPSYNYVWSDGNYGDQYIKWEIAPFNIADATVSAIPDQVYDASFKMPTVTIKRGNVKLKEGIDYQCAYENNLEAGKATVRIYSYGNYTGERVVHFNIVEQVHPHPLKKTAAKAATCTKAGNKAYWTCSTCKKLFSDSKGAKETTVTKMKIAAIGHKWDLGKITKQPTTKAEGVRTYTCTVCKETKTEKLPKLDPPPKPVATKSIRRAYGQSRYETSFAIADAYIVNSGKAKSPADLTVANRTPRLDAIIVACGTDFPDALAASYLAKVKKAPVILWREKDNAKVQEYIKENLKPGKRVYIMGGTGAVSANIAKGLSGYKFTRLGGDNRYGTNVKILNAAGVTGGEILVCEGTDFKNALIASATGKPILLVKPNGVTREGLGFLAGLKNPRFTIIGNEVSSAAETTLATYGKVTRVSGSNADQISVNVAKKYFSNPREVMVATSVNFADGLCGGLLAIQNNAPLLLLTDSQNSKAAAYTKTLTSLEQVTAFGGPAVVSDALAKKLLNVGSKKVDTTEYYRVTDKQGKGVLLMDRGEI